MDVLAYLKMELGWAHQLFYEVTQDVISEQLAWIPPGIANPLGAICAHAVLSEDAVINRLLKGEAPLFSGVWKDKTGLSNPQWRLQLEEARTLRVNLEDFRKYVQAVFDSAESYVSSLQEADLDREIDLTQQGLGEQSVGWVLAALIIGHLNNMSGEISCLKGIQGARGYPF